MVVKAGHRRESLRHASKVPVGVRTVVISREIQKMAAIRRTVRNIVVHVAKPCDLHASSPRDGPGGYRRTARENDHHATSVRLKRPIGPGPILKASVGEDILAIWPANDWTVARGEQQESATKAGETTWVVKLFVAMVALRAFAAQLDVSPNERHLDEATCPIDPPLDQCPEYSWAGVVSYGPQ